MNSDFFFLGLIRSSIVLLLGLILMAAAKSNPKSSVLIGRLSLLFAVFVFAFQPAPVTLKQLYSTTYISQPIQVTSPILDKEIKMTAFGATVNQRKPKLSISNEKQVPVELPPVNVSALYWFGGLTVFCIFLLLASCELRRIKQYSKKVSDITLVETARQYGLRAPSLRTSKSVRAPFIAGFFKPSIYLNTEWFSESSEEERRLVYSHELAHILYRDNLWLWITTLVRTALWINPLAWIVTHQIKLRTEMAADQSVVERGTDRREYCKFLLDLHEQTQGLSPQMSLPTVNKKSQLTKRIELLVSESASSRRKGATFALLSILLTGIATIIVLGKPSTQRVEKTFDIPSSVLVNDATGMPAKLKTARLIQWTQDGASATVKSLKFSSNRVELPTPDPSKTPPVLFVECEDGSRDFLNFPTAAPLSSWRMSGSGYVYGSFFYPKNAKSKVKDLYISRFVRRSDIGVQFFVVPHQMRKDFQMSPKVSLAGASSDRFSFIHLPEGCEVKFASENREFAHISESANVIPSSPTQTAGLPISFRFASSISGKVTHNGRPMPGIRVGAQGIDPYGEWGDAVTDERGGYEIFQLLPGSYNVTPLLSELQNKEFCSAAVPDVKLGETETKSANFQLIDGAILSGTVEDAVGNPLRGTLVGIYGPARPTSTAMVQSVKTDEFGRFQTRVPPGQQKVYLMDLEFDQGNVLVQTASSPTEVKLVAKSSQISSKTKIEPETRRASFDQKESIDLSPKSLGKQEGIVALLSLSEVIDDKAKSWSPNGKPITPERDLQNLGLSAAKRTIQFKLQLPQTQKNQEPYVFSVTTAHAGSVNYQLPGDGFRGWFEAPNDLAQTDLLFEISHGKWQVTGIDKEGAKSIVNKGNSTSISSVPCDLIIRHYDTENREIPITKITRSHGKGGYQFTFTYQRSGFKSLRLFARRIARVTFRGVQLIPKEKVTPKNGENG
jgi:beta-lactamase regulating signal transducer with metallopeptidase domain